MFNNSAAKQLLMANNKGEFIFQDFSGNTAGTKRINVDISGVSLNGRVNIPDRSLDASFALTAAAGVDNQAVALRANSNNQFELRAYKMDNSSSFMLVNDNDISNIDVSMNYAARSHKFYASTDKFHANYSDPSYVIDASYSMIIDPSFIHSRKNIGIGGNWTTTSALDYNTLIDDMSNNKTSDQLFMDNSGGLGYEEWFFKTHPLPDPSYNLDIRNYSNSSAPTNIALGVNNGGNTRDSTFPSLTDIGKCNGIDWKPLGFDTQDHHTYSKISASIRFMADASYYQGGLGFYTNDDISHTNMASLNMALTSKGKLYVGPGLKKNTSSTDPTVNKASLDVSGNTILRNGGLGIASGALTTTTPNYGLSGEVLVSQGGPDKSPMWGIPMGTPVGGMMMWAAATAPTGWLICDGTPVSRTTYAALFAVINTTYGAGDGSTTFTLPNLKNKFPLGAGTKVLTASGGDTTITANQMPIHNHTINDPGHTHTGTTNNTGLTGTFFPSASVGGGLTFVPAGTPATGTINPATGTTHSHSFTTNIGYTGLSINNAGGNGSGSTDEFYPPYLAINYIIFAGV